MQVPSIHHQLSHRERNSGNYNLISGSLPYVISPSTCSQERLSGRGIFYDPHIDTNNSALGSHQNLQKAKSCKYQLRIKDGCLLYPSWFISHSSSPGNTARDTTRSNPKGRDRLGSSKPPTTTGLQTVPRFTATIISARDDKEFHRLVLLLPS
ncbi:hypothetical protein Pcinc_014829 [Petrolisthes cinctipes]|uniref:Uncharacterized protein n=1 Tax=Petrolisthes cinctipes TaxID=88211 RepID=A0AAE1KNS6_PETCI|nr:hypothetical protein Pcinc_014829 [Petrolisthes cinctipes]